MLQYSLAENAVGSTLTISKLFHIKLVQKQRLFVVVCFSMDRMYQRWSKLDRRWT